MNLNVKSALGSVGRFIPGSIVARTTLCILALSMLLGLLFATGASIRAQRTEESRLRIQLQELLSTVESTTRIACFLGDDTLAKEISQGLLSNHAVSAVRIVAADKILYDSPLTPQRSKDGSIFEISRSIHSPFIQSQVIGAIKLFVSASEIRKQAQISSLNTALVLGLQVAFVAAGVALIVFALVTRPIRGISDELHRLEIDTGMRLQIPPANNSDEIGRLVADVNALIASLTSLLQSERGLRIEHQVQERKMKLILDKSATAIFVVDVNGNVQSWNPAFARIMKVCAEGGGVGIPRLHELLAPHGLLIDELVARALTTREPCNIDIEVNRGRAEAEWFELSLNSIDNGVLQGAINDITERKRAELSAHRAATHDALTGLLNRQGVANCLSDLVAHSTAERLRNVAFLQIDLDYFKQVNDTYGHDAGDRVLTHVARVLESAVRRSDLVGRPGGDEFVAILVGVDSLAKAQSIAEDIIARVNQPIDIGDGHVAHVSASIGIAAFGDKKDTADAVMRRADAAMYRAKQAGRSRACIAPPEDAVAGAAVSAMAASQ